MKFTKQNIERIFDKFMQGGDSLADLKEQILNLADTPEKVVVPKFVAEWIELCKEKANLVDCLQGGYRHFNGCEHIGEDEDWLFEGDNQDVVARAWLYGYEVEEEPLYCVIINGQYLAKMIPERNVHKFVEEVKLCVWSKQAYQLTEAEIKAIDKRYWSFAVKVDETE